MTATPGQHEDRRLLLLATVFGLAAVVALPLTAAAGTAVAALLSPATPIVLLLAGVLRGQQWLLLTGGVLLVVLLGILGAGLSGVDVEPIARLVGAVVAAGPVVAVVGVGLPLREADLVAGGAFLISATIAVISGFAAAGAAGATSLIVGVALLGFTIVALRLGRLQSADEEPR